MNMIPSLSTIIRTHSASARDLVIAGLFAANWAAIIALAASAKSQGLL